MRVCLFVLVVASGCVMPASDVGSRSGEEASAFVVFCGWSALPDPCVTDASPNDSPSQTEVDLAVNPTDPRNIFVASKDLDPLASDEACVWSVGQVTKDAGATWTTVYVGGTREERSDPTHPVYGWSCVTDPILLFDAEGVLYYVLQASGFIPNGEAIVTPVEEVRGAGYAYFLAVSRDGGETFPRDEIHLITPPDRWWCFHDYERGAVSPTTGVVVFVWTEYCRPSPASLPSNPTGIRTFTPTKTPYVAIVDDAGRSVRSTYIRSEGFPLEDHYFAGLTAGPDGAFYAWLQREDPVTRMADPVVPVGPDVNVLAVSRDDGATWKTTPMFETVPPARTFSDAKYRVSITHELAADTSDGPHRGRLYATWQDNSTGDPNVALRWSDDEGASWSEPVLVAEGAAEQWMPRIDVGADGIVHVLVMDRGYDPARKLIDLTHAWSGDGGATWQRQRVTSVSFDGDLGIHQSGAPFIGDYNGIDAIGQEVWFGFPTTVTGRAELGVALARRD